MSVYDILADEPFAFPADQRPALPGGPARPPQPGGRRAAYGAVGLLTGFTSGLGGALVSSNTGYLQGQLGISSNEVAWLPTVYLMTYVTMNLVLVRARQQFGLRLFALVGLAAFCIVTAAHEGARGLGGAIVIHALAGIATAPLLTMSTYYLMASVPGRLSLNASAFSVGLSQVPIPLSRLIPNDMLDLDPWRHIYHIELGLGLITLVAIALVRLPPSERSQAFETIDFVSWPLFAVGMALFTAVVGMGRVEWWTDRLWLGYALAAAIPIIFVACVIEAYRQRPLIDLRFLQQTGLFRFAAVILVLRLVLAEQSVFGFGILARQGLLNLDLRLYSAALTAASLFGALTAGVLFRPDRITRIGAIAFVVVAASAFVDSHSSSLTGPAQLYATQMTISFATSFAVGPSLLYGVTRVMTAGGRALATFMALFSIVQNVGNLLGSSLLSTFQVIETQRAAVALIARAPDFDPAVLALGREAGTDLQNTLNREAAIVAIDHGFQWVAIVALSAAAYLVVRTLIDRRAAARRSL